MYTFLVEDKAGLLWIGANYTLAAFDPTSLTFVSQQELDRRPPELSPEAAASRFFDGSWITGMAIGRDGEVVVARHNTNALYRADRGGLSVIRHLGQPPTGLRVIEGRVEAVVNRNDQVAVVDSDRVQPLLTLGNSGCSLSYRAPGEGARLTAGDYVHPVGLLLAPEEPIAFDETGKRAVLGVARDGAIVLADCARGTVDVVPLGSEFVFMDGLSGNSRINEPIQNLTFALDVAVSPGGTVAASTSAHQVILIR